MSTDSSFPSRKNTGRIPLQFVDNSQRIVIKRVAEPDVVHFKGLAGQIVQNPGVGFERKTEAIGIETLLFVSAEFFVQLIRAVLAVAEQGTA